MDQRLEAAQQALNAGRKAEAIDHLMAAIDANPAQNAGAYRVLVVQLYQAGRYAEGETYAAKGVQQHPRDFDLWNTRGVLLRRLKRYPEALAALDQAVRIAPNNQAGLNNRGNVLLDMGEGARAEQVFAKLARADPRNTEYLRQLGRALLKQGRREPAFVRFRSAVALKKDFVDAWLDMIGVLNEEHRSQEAEELCDKALAANPGHPRLLEAKSVVIRRSGQLRRAEQFLLDLLPLHSDAAWLHYQLGSVVSEWDRDRGNVHMRRAVELEPDKLDNIMALIESLERTRTGDEGANIEESYQLSTTVLGRSAEFTPAHLKIISEVLVRVCAFDELEALGDFRSMGRGWAETGRHTALLKQLARVRTDEDRHELVEQHRIWGRLVEKQAAERPIQRPAPRPVGEKIRLGFMSSDLRSHPVGYFALPLFDHVDRDRFQVFVYSYYQGQEDRLQTYIGGQVEAYRWWPDISAREAAQKIAEDDLDILVELGGSTHMNKLEVMAYRAAPRQASWLGYPHSAGLSTIDWFVCDPFSNPPDPSLLVEKPLMMPKTWLALGRAVFSDNHPITEGIPEERNGFVTFGTANNPHKYSREVLSAWARVVAATPGSRFAFIRPEGGSASFRRNIEAAFAAHGVAADRLVWHVTRGRHMPFYNEVDITLDPFPLTGGTTTTEALWMGVPVVSLVGKAFHERLSYSILSNAGVGDLCAADLAAYHDTALELVADKARRRSLRAGLREQIKASPLGQTEVFARDFYDMVWRAVREA
jgi:protein O-GlcNAc transferase